MPTHPSHHDPDDGPTGTTRTRLPEGGSAANRRPPARPSRTLVTVVGIVVLLIAALAFATRGTGSSDPSASSGGTSGSAAGSPQASSTAPTGTLPATSHTSGIPTGYPHTPEGAQSAAANYAVALGGDGMFKAASRHVIDDTVYTPSAAAAVRPAQDQAYSGPFLRKLGLDAGGDPPSGMTFISRTIPIGTKIQQADSTGATVSVWYTSLIGMAGTGSTDPVHTDWMTWTFHLRWTGSDWKIATDSQQNGPAPVPGDDQAASADSISKAVSQYGGFTYAR